MLPALGRHQPEFLKFLLQVKAARGIPVIRAIRVTVALVGERVMAVLLMLIIGSFARVHAISGFFITNTAPGPAVLAGKVAAAVAVRGFRVVLETLEVLGILAVLHPR